MTLAYIVRCNFSREDLEQGWNDWYGGPKLKQMLDKPHFLSVQRFLRSAGAGRNYVAFWILDSDQAFETPEYKNDWGFFEWKPYIIDWSRDLFAPQSGDVHSPVVGPDQALRIVSFEGLSAPEAAAAKAQVEALRPGVRWMDSVGLDRHTALIGYEVVAADAPERPLDIAGVVEGLYRPISDLVHADAAGGDGRG
ncbi:hypothetical protein [Aquabacter spiritensis]|uniref:NIPSNAP protein n=1 Tax=Aquabacter spiritensis TaxID=933073 RepID=A0A4R3LZM2_9HYPH|nr:hypothetical protein [Aquabacter spiritensis]TCT06214.1 hypothetical protein EDC64_103318 [Aquabacter spiritensis]